MNRRGLLRCAVATAVLGAAALTLGQLGGDTAHQLRKLAASLLTPIVLVWALLAALAVLLWHRGLRRLAALAGVGWLLVGLAGNPQVAAWQLALLEGEVESADGHQQAVLDVLLVLGGGVGISSRGRVTLGAAAERVLRPAELHRRGVAPLLATSGPLLQPPPTDAPLPHLPPPRSYPQVVAHLWTSLGVPREQIVLVEGPRNTREEVEAYRRLIEERGWRRVGLLTSAWHMRRALRHCRGLGVEVVAIPCDVRGEPPRWRWRHLFPSAGALENTTVAWQEGLALLVGR